MVRPSTTLYDGHPSSTSSIVLLQPKLHHLDLLSPIKQEFLRGDSSKVAFYCWSFFLHSISGWYITSLSTFSNPYLTSSMRLQGHVFWTWLCTSWWRCMHTWRYWGFWHNSSRILLQLVRLFGTTTVPRRLKNLLCCGESSRARVQAPREWLMLCARQRGGR